MTHSESPRQLAEIIVGDGAWTEDDALRVAQAYLRLLDAAAGALRWKGVYPQFCRDPEQCRGRGSCPRDPSCSE